MLAEIADRMVLPGGRRWLNKPEGLGQAITGLEFCRVFSSVIVIRHALLELARMNLKNCTAVITGASSGLGAEFARQLAPVATALALVARRESEMNALAAELQRTHPALRIAVIPCDLADPDQRAQLPGHLASMGWRVNVLINNAGLGDYGAFADGEMAQTGSHDAGEHDRPDASYPSVPAGIEDGCPGRYSQCQFPCLLNCPSRISPCMQRGKA